MRELIDYALTSDSQKLQNWKNALSYISSHPTSIGFNSQNFVWAPNAEEAKRLGMSPEVIRYINSILPHEFEHALQDGDKVYVNLFGAKKGIST